MRLIAMTREHLVELARGGFDSGEELARDLVRAQLVVHGRQGPVDMILDRQHVASELRRRIARRLLLLGFEPAADILGVRGGIKDLAVRLRELFFQLRDAIVLGKFGRVLRSFLADLLGVVVQLFVFAHAISLVSAFAVKSTMGTTRA